MAAAALTPRVRMMAVCDGVRESDYEDGVFHLKGVRQQFVAHAFPFVPPRMWLFVLMSNPRPGEFPCSVCVVNERTDKAVYYGHVEPRPRFGPDGGLWVYYAPIRCTFPEEGRYSVELRFFREEGSDVVKGEVPFKIVYHGD